MKLGSMTRNGTVGNGQSLFTDTERAKWAAAEEQILTGPLHEGIYRGHCLAGDDVFAASMTFEEAKAWAACHAGVEGRIL